MKQLIQNCKYIFSNYSISDAAELCFHYARLLIRNRVVSKTSNHSERFLSYTIQFPHRPAFFGLITEIFFQPFYKTERNKKSVLIFDCGTNIGIRTLFFKWMYPNARFVCFEPNPLVLEYLRNNIQKNHIENVMIHPFALGAKEGSLSLFRGEGDRGSGSATLVTNQFDAKNAITVPVKRLSDYIHEQVEIVKLDVEGVEGEIVEDLVLHKKMDFIRSFVIEYHFDGVHMVYPLQTLIEHLEHAGFTVMHTPLVAYNEKHVPVLKTCMVYAKR